MEKALHAVNVSEKALYQPVHNCRGNSIPVSHYFWYGFCPAFPGVSGNHPLQASLKPHPRKEPAESKPQKQHKWDPQQEPRIPGVAGTPSTSSQSCANTSTGSAFVWVCSAWSTLARTI